MSDDTASSYEMVRLINLLDYTAAARARITFYTSKAPTALEALRVWSGSRNLTIRTVSYPASPKYGTAFTVHSVGVEPDFAIDVYEDGAGFGVHS